jgi:predicted dehydrogenase
MLRGAIIGLGNVAIEGHLPGWLQRDDVAITAVADVVPARRAATVARLPAARWYDAPEGLIAQEPLDFIDICTPPSSHGPLIVRGLHHGLHVLCEKPLVMSSAELAPVLELAAETGRVVHTVHNWHHAPIVKRTTDLLQQGAIGRVRHVVWQTLRVRPAAVRDAQASNWRLDPALAGGGVLTDHGWHVFYVICRWIGESPTSVAAHLETRRHTASPVEDTATVRLAFPDATAEIFLTWAAADRGNRVELVGTDGSLELADDTLVLRLGGREQRWPCPPALSNGSVHPDWFEPVASQFVGEVTGARPRAGNLAEASLCAILEGLARESHRRGGQTLAVPGPAVPAS